MPRGASLTAEAVCFFRALEQTRAPANRIVDDPFAARMLSRRLSGLAASPGVRRALISTGAAGLGGLQRFVAARHRIMDEAMLAFIAGGGTQVVILGVGYDTRAWRFGANLTRATVWEVDFPATQDRKKDLLHRGRIADVAVKPPRFLAVDFERQDVGEALVADGVDGGARVLFIWEGVTMYLTEGAVRGALRTMAAVGGPRSEVIFDAWHAPAGNAARWFRRQASLSIGLFGEPLKYSLAQCDAPGMLGAEGWDVADMCGPSDVAARVGLRHGAVFPDTHLVHARKR